MTNKSLTNEWEERLQNAAHPGVYWLMKRLIGDSSVVKIPGVGLIVSDAGMIREIMSDTERFTKTGKGGPAGLWTPITGPTALVNMDGPDHINLRRKIGPLFSPRVTNALAGTMMNAPVSEMKRRLNAGETVDIVQEVTRIAGSMICNLTGLDASDESVFEAVSQAKELTSQASLRGTISDKKAAYARSVLSKLMDPVASAYDKGDESTVPGKLKSLGLTVEEAMGVSSAFIIAGTETVIAFIPRMVALLIESGWDRKLVAEPEKLESVIMEGLRLTVPALAAMRVVREDSVIGGKEVKAGQKIILMTLLATRKAPQGGTFNPDIEIPSAIKNIWFGAGPHFCIGMPLAMAQVRVVLSALMEIIEDGGQLEIVNRAAQRNTFSASYTQLNIRKANTIHGS